MRSFGGTAKRLQHTRDFREGPSSGFVRWIRDRLAQIVRGVQPVGIILANFSSIPRGKWSAERTPPGLAPVDTRKSLNRARSNL